MSLLVADTQDETLTEPLAFVIDENKAVDARRRAEERKRLALMDPVMRKAVMTKQDSLAAETDDGVTNESAFHQGIFNARQRSI